MAALTRSPYCNQRLLASHASLALVTPYLRTSTLTGRAFILECADLPTTGKTVASKRGMEGRVW